MTVNFIIPVLDRCFSRLLPAPKFNSAEARQLLVSIALQESLLTYRDQLESPGGKDLVVGPALGLWQNEQGTRSSRGGVWGAMLHPASEPWLRKVCEAAGVPFDARSIWLATKGDDAFACAVARLLIFTDAAPLPVVGAEELAWQYYVRVWRPGAYTRGTPEKRAELRAKWATNYRSAQRILAGG